MQRFSFVFLVGGVGLFVFAFLTLALAPWVMLSSVRPVAMIPDRVPMDFEDRYATPEAYRAALFRGRDRYVAEGCWHCHSQYIRPVGNEAARYGPVSEPGEYENELQRPQMFGTRRVGPDLIREAGRHTNDWHYAHLYEPRYVVPDSVMPSYRWLFKEDKTPNEDGVALVAYLQWLGSWVEREEEQ